VTLHVLVMVTPSGLSYCTFINVVRLLALPWTQDF